VSGLWGLFYFSPCYFFFPSRDCYPRARGGAAIPSLRVGGDCAAIIAPILSILSVFVFFAPNCGSHVTGKSIKGNGAREAADEQPGWELYVNWPRTYGYHGFIIRRNAYGR